MKKKLLALLVALTLICSMFATISVSAASDTTLSMQSLGGTTGWDDNGYPGIYAVMFGYGAVLSLGNINLADYDTIEVTYASDPNYFVTKTGAMEMNACFAVYSVNRSVGWPAAGGEHNAEGLLAKADTTAGPGGVVAWKVTERKVSLDVSAVDYSGPVYLSHYNPLGHEALVVGIKLIAKTGGGVTPPPSTPGTYDAQITINSINSNIWANNTTIIYEPSYSGTITAKWHNAIICTYSEEEGAYVVTTKWGETDDRSGVTITSGQILIDSCGTGVTSNAEGWAAVQVGSLIYLEGVDLDAKTVSADAFAGIVNDADVDLPPAPVPPISAFQTSIDHTFVDGVKEDNQGAGGTATYTFANPYDIEESIAFAGWAATANGVAKYQYSIDGENFYDIEDATISARDDLANAGIPYDTGHSTAGFTVTLPVSAFNDGTNNLTIRLIDTQDGYVDILKATVNATNPGGAQVPGGDSDDDQNNNNNNNNNNQDTNVGTDDSVAVVFVMMVAIVAMAAVVIKRRKENV